MNYEDLLLNILLFCIFGAAFVAITWGSALTAYWVFKKVRK